MKTATQRLFIIVSLLLCGLFTPSFADAQLDQRCWTQAECEAFVKEKLKISPEVAKKSFVVSKQTAKACGGVADMGFCLAAGSADIAVKIGKHSNFNNIAEYIKAFYTYIIPIATIIAILMIIVAGVQWMVSGGNATVIGSAKKRIIGAISGLVLLALSFTILATINPYLVNLRLPQTWLLNTKHSVPSFCRNIKDDKKIALLGKAGIKYKVEQINEVIKKGFKIDKDKGECGKSYLMEGGGGLSCLGHVCSSKKHSTCVSDIQGTDAECKPGKVVGTIYNSSWSKDAPSWFTEDWNWPWVVDPTGPGGDAIDLEGVCDDGHIVKNLASMEDPVLNNSTRTETYTLSPTDAKIESAVSTCKKHGGFKGFVLDTSFNENDDTSNEDHYIGEMDNLGVDLGDGGAFAKVSKKVHKKFLISLEDVKAGIMVNIDAGQVTDIDEEGDRAVYAQYGY